MDKKELRKLYRSKRTQLSEAEIFQMSGEIKSSLFMHYTFSRIASVHVFLPMETKKEIYTYKIIHHLWKDFPNVQVVVPKMVGENLVSIVFNKDTPLMVNEWGIPEPLSNNIYDDNLLEMVLIPLLAYDRNGNRIGYGKGFYDKFLSQCRPDVMKVGLSFFEPEESINAEEFDVPLDSCITPTEFHIFNMSSFSSHHPLY